MVIDQKRVFAVMCELRLGLKQYSTVVGHSKMPLDSEEMVQKGEGHSSLSYLV
jgi:hypothetical protein